MSLSKTHYELMEKAVAAKFVPVYATSYADVKEGLEKKYGDSGWRGAMAQAISGSEARNGKEYLAARRSIERYEAGTFKGMRKYSPKVADVGKTLPPIGQKLPGNELTITVQGPSGDGRTRSFTTTFKGADAYAFAQQPTVKDILRNKYPPSIRKNGKMMDDPVVEALGEDGTYPLEVTYAA